MSQTRNEALACDLYTALRERRTLPPLANETITLIKDTSLIYVLALNDLLRAARGFVQRDFTITPFIVAAVFYLLMTLILTWVFQRLERRYAEQE